MQVYLLAGSPENVLPLSNGVHDSANPTRLIQTVKNILATAQLKKKLEKLS